MLAKNITYLKKYHAKIYDVLSTPASFEEKVNIEDGNLYLTKEGVTYALHSEVSTGYESGVVYNNVMDNEEYNVFVFLGVGLGHHITYFAERHPNANIFLCEPNKDIFNAYLDFAELPQKNVKGIFLGKNKEYLMRFMTGIMAGENDKIAIVETPTYRNFYAEEINMFYDVFKTAVRNKRSSVHTNFGFQKKWIINSLNNFLAVIQTPNIFDAPEELFKGKPVIIAASGPSITEEIENLKQIKQDKSAYIFAVGSAVHILVKNGVLPDATLSYDPGRTQHLNHDILRENKIRTIPLIFGSTVGQQVIKNYPGPLLNVLTSQDRTSEYYIENYKTRLVSDAPSIAVIALQILTKLKVGTIIFAGQNLAYKDKKWYAEGQRQGYEKLDQDKTNENQIVYVENVYGEEVSTTNKLNSFRLSLETIIKMNPGIEYLNTTTFGAKIAGTTFMPMVDLISEKLKPDTIDSAWHKKISIKGNVDFKEIYYRNVALNKAIPQSINEVEAVEGIVLKINKLLENNNIKQIEKAYAELDASYKKLEENPYYKYFIAPMNRVHFEKLIVDIRHAKQNTNLRQRAKNISGGYSTYMKIIKADALKMAIDMQKFTVHVDKFIKSLYEKNKPKQ